MKKTLSVFISFFILLNSTISANLIIAEENNPNTTEKDPDSQEVSKTNKDDFDNKIVDGSDDNQITVFENIENNDLDNIDNILEDSVTDGKYDDTIFSSDDSTFFNNYTDNASDTNYSITLELTDNQNLTSSPNEITYNIIFDGNGETSGSTETMLDLQSGTVYKLQQNNFKKRGHSFTGWNTIKDGSGISFVNEEEIIDINNNEENVVLYAQWKLKSYNIIYNLDEGDNSPNNPDTYSIVSDNITFENPTKKGYTFKGWYTDSNLTKTITSIPSGSTGNKTIYAKWKANSYTVKFNGNGSTSGSMANQSRTYGDGKTLTSNAFKRTGYTFTGWNTKADGSGTAYKNKLAADITSANGKTITLYAQWQVKTFCITYFYVDNAINANPVYYSYDPLQTIQLNDPTRDGYVFEGWYSNSNYIDRIYHIDRSQEKDIQIYAKWGVGKYTVIFDRNTGTGSMDNTIYDCNKTYNLPKNKYLKTGYRFTGWNTDINGNGVSYSDQNEITNLSLKSGDIVRLYAQWELIDYSIIYHLNKGINAGSNPTTYNFESNSINLNNPSRNGYDFGGWYSDENFSEYFGDTINKNSTGELDLYAKWNPINYSIEYHLSGGQNNPENIYQYNIESSDLILKDAIKTGYSFEGWYLEEDHINKIEIIHTGSMVDVEIYAKFSLITYGINYDLDGGVFVDDFTETFNVESGNINIPNPIKTGYEFLGWTGSNGNIPQKDLNISSYVAESRHYKANWEIIKYQITYYGLNGGTNNSNNPNQYTVETETINLKDPSRTGYEFVGWYSDADFYNIMRKIEKGSTENIILYAGWQPVVYSINYSLLGGTNDSSNPTEYTIESETINLKPATKNGYDFKGWCNDTVSNDTIISAVRKGSTGNLSLFAKWEATKYTINYELNGGTNNSNNPNQYTIDTETINLKDPSRIGYDFAGWVCVHENGNQENSYSIVKGTSENLTFVANWQVKKYTISFESNGGSTIEDISFDYDESVLLPDDPTLQYKSFDGWYFDEGCKNRATSFTMPAHDLILYAKWKDYDINVSHNNLKAIKQSDEFTSDLFGLEAVDTNGNVLDKFSFTIISGSKEAGQTINVSIVVTGLYGVKKNVSVNNIKVYDETEVVIESQKDYLLINETTDEELVDLYSVFIADSFGESLNVQTLLSKNEIQVGDTVDLTFFAEDEAGNVTSETIQNVIVCDYPSIVYDEEKEYISINDVVDSDLLNANAYDCFGQSLDLNIQSDELCIRQYVNIILSAIDSRGVEKSITLRLKVCGNPTISNATVKEIKDSDEITPELLGISAKDSWNNDLDVLLDLVSGEEKAGQEVSYVASVVDFAGNTSSKQIEGIKIYGIPTLSINHNWQSISATPTYNHTNVTISFDSDGGTSVPSQTIGDGDLIKYPNVPVKKGFVFCGWYTSKTTQDETTLFDFTQNISDDIVLYAKWYDTKIGTLYYNYSYTYKWIDKNDFTYTNYGNIADLQSYNYGALEIHKENNIINNNLSYSLILCDYIDDLLKTLMEKRYIYCSNNQNVEISFDLGDAISSFTAERGSPIGTVVNTPYLLIEAKNMRTNTVKSTKYKYNVREDYPTGSNTYTLQSPSTLRIAANSGDIIEITYYLICMNNLNSSNASYYKRWIYQNYFNLREFVTNINSSKPNEGGTINGYYGAEEVFDAKAFDSFGNQIRSYATLKEGTISVGNTVKYNVFAQDKLGNKISKDFDIKVYSKDEPIYYISYENTLESINLNPVEYHSDDIIELNDLSKEGYTFLGWYIGEEKIETIYHWTGDVVLIARWE